MFTMGGIVALGASSNPGTGRENTAAMALNSMPGLALVAWTYYRIWLNVVANQQVVERIVALVGKIHQQRGLDG